MPNVPPKFPDSLQVGDETTGYTIPAARGAAGQALIGDGAGETDWAPASGAFTMPPNTVQVDPAEPEVPGERYQTVAAAQAYVATQAPAVDNPWGIKVSGVVAEDILVGAYVYILGEPGTILTGELTTGVTVTYAEYVVANCQVDDFLIDGAGQHIGFQICTITGGNSTAAGSITLSLGAVTGGDFSALALTFMTDSNINGGTFGEFLAHNHIFRGCTFQDPVPLVLGGGDFYGCQLWLQTGNTTFNDGIYRMRGGCYIRLPNPTTFAGGQDLDWHNVVLASTTLSLTGTNQCELASVVGDSGSITINGAGVSVETYGCTNLPVTYTAGTWTNEGVEYDNRTSGLVSTETQGAIDELALRDDIDTFHEYGETMLVVRNATASTSSTINNCTRSSAYDVWQYLDTAYNYCYFDIKLYDGGVLVSTFTELRFSTQAEVIAWVDANVPRDGLSRFIYTARMRCYDKVDTTVPAPNRIWAVNRNYARLRDPDTGYYDRSSRRSVSPNSRWSRKAQFLEELWQAVYGVPHPDAGGFHDESYECFWFSGRKQNFYRCGYEDTRMEFPAPGYKNRSMVTPAGIVTGAQDTKWWYYDNTGKLTIPAVVGDGTSWEFLQHGVVPDNKIFSRQAYLFQLGYAVCVAYGMTDDDGNRSILIKPVTIDTFYLPYLVAGHRYEYIANYDMQGTNKIRVLPGTSAYVDGNVSGPWGVSELIFGTVDGGKLFGASAKPGSVRFQLRNTTTGHISPLSNARIRFFGRRRYLQLSALVESAGAR